MKRIMLFMMLMLGTVSAVMAQGADVPATDYDATVSYTHLEVYKRQELSLWGSIYLSSPSANRCRIVA